MKINSQTIDLLQRVAAKLNEKSSVYGYAMVLASLFASKWQGDFAKGAEIVSAGASVALFFLSDPQVRYLLTGQKPAEPIKPTLPADQSRQP
jgi:hypothetical protein